jgi:uracil-DNA glycosylase
MTVHVPPDWPQERPCKLAFVAEAPSDVELDKGIPLVGPAGRVFDALLRTAGIPRPEHFIGNVFDEKLPENEVASWCAPMEEARKWEGYLMPDLPPIGRKGYLRPAHLWHLDRLQAELEKADPTVIVPLGATALWAFTGTDAITVCRGAVSEAKFILPGRKILPTFHPAHVIHQWKYYHIVVGDLMKAVREAEFPEVRPPHWKLYLEPSLADFRKFKADRLDGAPCISIDIETGWGQITCIGFAPNPGVAMTVPFVDFRKPNRCYWGTLEEELEAWALVKAILEGPEPKAGQNFTYDIFWLLDLMGIRVMNYREDTRLLHHAIYPELPKDLGFMGACYTRQGPWKLMRGKKPDKGDD